MVAPHAGARPVVDGNLNEWAGLSQTLLNKDTASSITGDDSDLRRPQRRAARRLGARCPLLRGRHRR